MEYQDRGTLHFHIAIWCIPKHAPTHYIGRTGLKLDERTKWRQTTSPFHAYLEHLFKCHVDVQWTHGRVNYINGYTTKGQDALDFRLDEETMSGMGKAQRWLSVYRLLCRKVVCVPEVALWFYEAEPMTRSCRIGV